MASDQNSSNDVVRAEEPTQADEDVTDMADPLAGLLGGLDMGSLLSMAGEMHEQLEASKREAAATVVEGTAGGGVVRITMTGAMECTGVTIAPDAAADIAMLEDLVLAAVRDALSRAMAVQGEDPLSGLGDIGGLLGG